jgi:RNA polymerase sigma factor (sigma-70 family)
MSLDDRAPELQALLGRVALGDRAAFGVLYRTSAAHLLGVILRIQNDRAQAEDVLQEVFVNVWKSAGSYDAARAAPMAWLASVARNRAIDSLRRRKTEPLTQSSSVTGADGEEQDLLARFASPDPGPQEKREQADQALALRGCMARLSAEQQQCLSLAYYQGLSHGEVAEHLKQPLGTVKSWVRRALSAVRACLEQAGIASAA